MATSILGLDIGGANLKAATPDKCAVSVPFPLWKQPDKLPAALAALVGQFPDAEELAVTMTGELCDCFETKREGVNAILSAVEAVAGTRAMRVWTALGKFVSTSEAREAPLVVASANWCALATFACRFVLRDGGILIDIGSTTTDLIPLTPSGPEPSGFDDGERLEYRELVYVGTRRTPVFAIINEQTMAEYFATSQDVYVVLGMIPEEPENRDTADGRPLTREYSRARLARMLGGDKDSPPQTVLAFAKQVHSRLVKNLREAASHAYHWDIRRSLPPLRTAIISGAGEHIAREVVQQGDGLRTVNRIISLNDELGPVVSACAPAYAVAVLATERRP